MRINKQWIVAKHPVGSIQTGDLVMREAAVEPLQDGMVQVRTLYLSLDPTNRVWLFKRDTYWPALQPGQVMRGLCIGRVEASRSPRFSPGDLVQGLWGWQLYHTSDGADLMPLAPLPHLPLTAYFGLLGHIGLTAHYGILEIGKPKPGETVVVSAASGAVGSLAGQIAKMSGARVVGITGSDEKCRRITRELGFDAAINYKKTSVLAGLQEHCPHGIDVYFDNVGGEILDMVLGHANNFARIVSSGMIAIYNQLSPGTTLTNIGNLGIKRIRMEGFIGIEHMDHADKAYADLLDWHQAGRLQYQVDLVPGLENALTALYKLFDGTNNGKLIVAVSDEQTQGAYGSR